MKQEDIKNKLDKKLWSYSCLESFWNCKHGWYLNYIARQRSNESGCFSSYGSLCHEILEEYLKGDRFSFEVGDEFTDRYMEEVSDTFPPCRGERLFDKYYDQGIAYFGNPENVENLTNKFEVLGVEDKNIFYIDKYKFTGILDVEVKNKVTGEYEIVDHKSKGKQDKKRKSKKMNLDGWLTLEDGRYVPRALFNQQYMYCIPFKEKFNQYPSYLNLNMFRLGDWYKLKFNKDDFDIAIQWAKDTIESIYKESKRNPDKNGDDFFCKYLCDNNCFCKYSDKYVGEE